jgi:methyl-accepting chemotaxis protein
VIQANASAAEQLSATSEELARQALQMESAISFFKVEGSGHAPMARENSNRKPHRSLAPAVSAKALPARQSAQPKQVSKGIALHLNSDSEDASFEQFSGTEAKP